MTTDPHILFKRLLKILVPPGPEHLRYLTDPQFHADMHIAATRFAEHESKREHERKVEIQALLMSYADNDDPLLVDLIYESAHS